MMPGYQLGIFMSFEDDLPTWNPAAFAWSTILAAVPMIANPMGLVKI